MPNTHRRATIYFDEELHRALKVKAASTGCTVSELVNRAVRDSLEDDLSDLRAIKNRINEPTLSYQALLEDLKAHGKL